MTPARIAEIFAEETGFNIADKPAAIEDFARRMWNEAIIDAAECAMSEAKFWSDCDDARPNKACLLIVHAIRDLKLPEDA